MRLRDFETTIDVPSSVKGLDKVADYITKDQAMKFAKKITPRTPRLSYGRRVQANVQNWYDSHIDAITALLEEMRDRLREKHYVR